MALATLETNQLKTIQTYSGANLYDLSLEGPVMLIFLRHFGCTFCREAMAELGRKREEIGKLGTKIVFVHLSDDDTAIHYFEKYRLSGVDFISDPEAKHYADFGLIKGKFNQLFGLKVWMRTMETAVIKGHGGWKPIGDGFQMPGVFMIHKGIIKDQFIHKFISDRPDYSGMVNCCVL